MGSANEVPAPSWPGLAARSPQYLHEQGAANLVKEYEIGKLTTKLDSMGAKSAKLKEQVAESQHNPFYRPTLGVENQEECMSGRFVIGPLAISWVVSLRQPTYGIAVYTCVYIYICSD